MHVAIHIMLVSLASGYYPTSCHRVIVELLVSEPAFQGKGYCRANDWAISHGPTQGKTQGLPLLRLKQQDVRGSTWHGSHARTIVRASKYDLQGYNRMSKVFS